MQSVKLEYKDKQYPKSLEVNIKSITMLNVKPSVTWHGREIDHKPRRLFLPTTSLSKLNFGGYIFTLSM